MYLHIGNNVTVKQENIIGIFDLDNVTVSKRSREFLNKAEKENRIVYEGFELPKSFIVCCEKKEKNRVYLSLLNTATLEKRIKSPDIY